MQLGLTIPLIRHLKKKNIPYGQEPTDRFFCWDLHIITLQKSKSLLAVHCSSRFTFVVWDMTIADWGLLADTAANGIRHSLQEAGISKDNICRYFEKAGPAELTKTHGRREVAFLNRAWEDVITLDILTDQSQQWQTTLNEAVNDLPRRCAGREGQQTPAENLLQDFQERLSAR